MDCKAGAMSELIKIPRAWSSASVGREVRSMLRESIFGFGGLEVGVCGVVPDLTRGQNKCVRECVCIM